MTTPAAPENKFDWPLCHEAEQLLLGWLDTFTARNSFAALLQDRMRTETGTLLIDWVDHLVVPRGEEARLRGVGFTDDPLGEVPHACTALWHPEALLPRLVLGSPANGLSVALRCDSLADFMAAHRICGRPEGVPLSRYRQVLIAEEPAARLLALERRGYRGYVTAQPPGGAADSLVMAHELWRTRCRDCATDEEGWQQAHELLDELIRMLGRNLACHVVFCEERLFWQGRNRAAQLQKQRQDKLGLGWANHDHHTFRSSRRHFIDLMRALEKLGFERRERYYAGAEAGWGAQILEQPVEGIVAFCDVDLQPEETEIDFSRLPLPEVPRLGTIGLWTGLHGESFLQAGMHHLECRFDHEALRDQLATLGIATMAPFSDLPFLWQAFTEGERWPVRRERAQRLLEHRLIDPAQFDQFITAGAIGSHLENLQRHGGFKGFNQQSVSAIIAAVDPRKQTR